MTGQNRWMFEPVYIIKQFGKTTFEMRKTKNEKKKGRNKQRANKRYVR